MPGTRRSRRPGAFVKACTARTQTARKGTARYRLFGRRRLTLRYGGHMNIGSCKGNPDHLLYRIVAVHTPLRTLVEAAEGSTQRPARGFTT